MHFNAFKFKLSGGNFKFQFNLFNKKFYNKMKKKRHAMRLTDHCIKNCSFTVLGH